MEVLLQKAIEINSTTILPNFGAFMKMGKSVLFNEFLKYDDGKLAKAIAEIENISEDDAKAKITSWIDATNKKLDSGESITLPGIGVLVREDGKLKFTAGIGKDNPYAKPTNIVEDKKEEVKEFPKSVEIEEKEVLKEEIKPEVKPVEKPVSKIVNISTDFSAQDAIDKIKSFTNKSDLIDFTRADKRKTVIDALNKKLDGFNGKETTLEKKETIDTPEKTEEKTEIEKTKPADPIAKTPKEEIKEKEVPKPLVEEKVKPVPPVVERKVEEKVVTPVTKQKEENKKEEEKKVDKPIASPPKEESIKENKAKTEKSIDDKAIAAIASSVEKTEKELKKRKRRKLVLLLAIICLLVGGGLIGFLKKDLIMAYFDKKHEPKELADNTAEHNEEESEDNEDEKVENTVVVEEDAPDEDLNNNEIEDLVQPEAEVKEVPEEKIQEEVVPVVTNSSAEGNYHIIAGSFSSEENASNKVEDLKSKGYNSAKVLGQYGGLYTVRAMSFTTNSEAKEALKNFKAEGNKGFVKKL